MMRLRWAYDEALAEFALAQRPYEKERTTTTVELAGGKIEGCARP
jgi:hypothetical protein